MSKKRIILSAGGTGGHVMPAQALARDLVARGNHVELITDERGLKYKEPFGDIPIHVIKAGTLGRGLLGKVRGALDLGLGVLQAARILRQTRPDSVVGFGGYPSFPALYAAQRQKIPTILHEQNAIIGKANAMLAKKACRIASSVPTLQGIDDATRPRTIFTGNPVREDIAALYDKPYPELEEGATLCILVMGGSLGAKVFSDILPKALSRLPDTARARLQIIQQCREQFIDQTRAAYKQANIDAEISPFIHDVAKQLQRAHLFIGRSGASTVAEINAAGRPAIYVPYPHHKDQQQKLNAEVVVAVNGAWLMTEGGAKPEFTADAVLEKIEEFLKDPSILNKAAAKSRGCARLDAARKLGDIVTEIING